MGKVRLILVFLIFLSSLLIPERGQAEDAGVLERIYVLHESDRVFMQFRREIAISKRYRGRYVQNYEFPSLRYAEYILKPGDNLPSVAARLGVSVDAIASASGVVFVHAVSSGDRILVPNFDGISYVSSSSSTLEELSAKYNVPVADIRRFNGWRGGRLPRGGRLFIPGATMEPLEQGMFYGTAFASPLDEVLISSRFGVRSDPFTGHRAFHGGIDFAAPMGTPVRAAHEGVVEFAAWSGGYGNLIAIRHAFGYRTLYGHLQRMDVRVGQRVRMGEVIGRVGSTGHSTGPHLHFELRHYGQPIDPMRYTVLQHRDRPAAVPTIP
jgi:murein DD-endopeptidase MepM/ murein hydrolase activator NlpD